MQKQSRACQILLVRCPVIRSFPTRVYATNLNSSGDLSLFNSIIFLLTRFELFLWFQFDNWMIRINQGSPIISDTPINIKVTFTRGRGGRQLRRLNLFNRGYIHWSFLLLGLISVGWWPPKDTTRGNNFCSKKIIKGTTNQDWFNYVSDLRNTTIWVAQAYFLSRISLIWVSWWSLVSHKPVRDLSSVTSPGPVQTKWEVQPAPADLSAIVIRWQSIL